jgi:hypothetical protein
MMMKPEDKDTTIADIHRIREQIAAKFGGDLNAINDDARARMERSGCVIIRREPTADQPTGKAATK